MKGRGISIWMGLFLIAFLLVGCDTEGSVKESETTEIETEAAPARESEQEYRIYHRYENFEESVIRASYIAEAICVDSYAEDRYTYAIFELKETLKGEFTDTRIVMRADSLGTMHYCSVLIPPGTDLLDGSHYEREYYTDYEIGKEYLLVLEGGSIAYHGFTLFHSVNDIFFSDR